MSLPPEESDLLRWSTCPIDGTLQESRDRIQHLWEVNGWDLWKVRYPVNASPQMFFKKPATAPDVTPFIDPNPSKTVA